MKRGYAKDKSFTHLQSATLKLHTQTFNMRLIPASNNQIKEWKKLQRGKYRKKHGLFLAEGLRCVEQILDNNFIVIREILTHCEEDIKQLDVSKSIPIFELSSDQFQKISDTETPQGVIAVCEIPDEIELPLILSSEGIIIMLDEIQDPGNLGTMIRTAAWFGVTAVVLGDGCVDLFHPKVVRSTAGATSSIPHKKGDLNLLLNEFESKGWETILMDAGKSAVPLQKYTPTDKTVLVIGNEGNGIQSALFKEGRKSIKISATTKKVESLNAAIALSIALFSLTPHQSDS